MSKNARLNKLTTGIIGKWENSDFSIEFTDNGLAMVFNKLTKSDTGSNYRIVINEDLAHLHLFTKSDTPAYLQEFIITKLDHKENVLILTSDFGIPLVLHKVD